MKSNHPPTQPSRLELVKRGVGVASHFKRQGRLNVSINKLIEDPRNERKTFRGMEGLVASIKAVGVVEALTVTPMEGDRYMIITGHRRFRAAKEAGLSEIEVLIRDPEGEPIRRRKSIVSNVQRENLGPMEMAEGLQALLDEDDQINTQRQLATVIGKSEAWVSDILRILELPATLQTKLRTSEVSPPYDAVAKIARLNDPPLMRQLVDDLLHGATSRDIRVKIDAAKGVPADTSPSPKPKRVYHTSQQATVIVQSKTRRLSDERCVEALEEAIRQARGPRRDAA